jgi:hypothetical protein
MHWYSTAQELAASMPGGLPSIVGTSLAFAALALAMPHLGLPFAKSPSQRLYWFHTLAYLVLVGGALLALAREPEPIAMHRAAQPFTRLVIAGETGFLVVATGIMALRRSWIPSLLIHHILFAAILGWCLLTGQAIVFLAWAMLVQATGFIYYPMCILRASSEVDRRVVAWLAAADSVAVFLVRVVGFTAVTALLGWQYASGPDVAATWPLVVIGTGAGVLVALNLFWFVGSRRRASRPASVIASSSHAARPAPVHAPAAPVRRRGRRRTELPQGRRGLSRRPAVALRADRPGGRRPGCAALRA